MKKKFLIASVLIGTVALISSLAFASNLKSESFVKGFDVNHDHTVIFEKEHMHHKAYDEDNYAQEFGMSKSDAIVVSETEKYDCGSYDGIWTGTYYCGNKNKINFESSSYMFELTGDNVYGSSNYAYIYFELKYWATVDLEKSVLLYDNLTTSATNQTIKLAWDDSKMGEDTFFYYFDLRMGSYFGETFGIKQVKLVFSC